MERRVLGCRSIASEKNFLRFAQRTCQKRPAYPAKEAH